MWQDWLDRNRDRLQGAACRLFAAVAAVALVLVVVPAAVPASAAAVMDSIAAFKPHRAIYELSLDRRRPSPEVARADGRLEFEWSDVCTGWTVRQRSRVLLDRVEGMRIDFGWSLNAWESKSGLRYRFFIQRFADGERTDEANGEARLEAIGGPGTAIFESPELREVVLPRGTVFPSWHSFEIIEAAQQDALPLWSYVFDGSGEPDGVSGVSTVLAEALPADAGSDFDSELTAEVSSWRIALAYFELESEEITPTHEQSLRLYANGVTDDLVFDYGDFALRGRLVELEALPEPGC